MHRSLGANVFSSFDAHTLSPTKRICLYPGYMHQDRQFIVDLKKLPVKGGYIYLLSSIECFRGLTAVH